MKRAAVLCAVALCALTALSWAESEKKPPATETPGELFSASTTATPAPNITMPTTTHLTPAPNATTPTTTHPTPAPNATTPTTTHLSPAPNTTTPTTTHPTPAPNTTTPTTTHPTPAPNTTTPTTTHPTPAPNTTTASTTKATTTPKPTPPQPTPSTNVTVGSYNVTIDKKVCLMAQMGLQIRLQTPKANGTFIVQPQLTTASGDCKETTASLKLSFKEGHITFMFNKSVADNEAYVDALSFQLAYPLDKKGSIDYTADNKSVHLFPARIGHAYSCKKESLYMGNGLYLDVTQDRMQGFNLTKSNDFGTSDMCPADKPDYRVAIAVGVTLLVLILVVVVAYLLGRRKRTDGYQSL